VAASGILNCLTALSEYLDLNGEPGQTSRDLALLMSFGAARSLPVSNRIGDDQ
jgi:hypothetical protein